MKIKLPTDSEPGFQMAPMIDITFLLIIFFMVVAKQTQTQFKKIENPVAIHASIAKERGDRGVITIGDDEEIYLGSYPTDLDNIRKVLSDRIADNPKFVVQLRVDARVKHAKVREIMSACAEAGALDIIFSAYQSDK